MSLLRSSSKCACTDDRGQRLGCTPDSSLPVKLSTGAAKMWPKLQPSVDPGGNKAAEAHSQQRGGCWCHEDCCPQYMLSLQEPSTRSEAVQRRCYLLWPPGQIRLAGTDRAGSARGCGHLLGEGGRLHASAPQPGTWHGSCVSPAFLEMQETKTCSKATRCCSEERVCLLHSVMFCYSIFKQFIYSIQIAQTGVHPLF